MLTNKRGPRGEGTYKIKQPETRGKYMQENKTLKAFWVEYSMEEAMQWTEAELEEKIEDFITRLAKRSIDRDPNWWYPEWKRIDMRHYK